MILLTSIAVLVALVAIWVLFAKWTLDVVSIFCFSFILFYGFRMVVVATGVDGLYPDYLFSSDASAVETVNLLLVGFLVCTGVGLAVGQATKLKTPWLFPAVERRPAANRYWVASLVLTGLATIITGFLMVRYGGFAGMVRASKFDKELAGTFLLRMVPSMGSAVAAAGFLDLRQRALGSKSHRLRRRAWAMAAMAAVDGLWVYAWGSRSQLVFVAFVMLAGLAVFRAPKHRDRPARLLVRLVVVALCVAGVIVGLRVGRDVLIAGTVNDTIADQSFVRQVSVASNATSYDAFVLSVRDWPEPHAYRDGEDFLVGTTGIVPRSLWAGKPEQIIPGAWFRQVYEPSKRNGWPMGVAGEWYLNFGPAGVLLGGFVSGIVLAFAQRTLHRARTNPFAFTSTAVVGFLVLELGVGSQFVLRWVGFVLPLILLTYVLKAGPAPPSGEGADDVAPTALPSRTTSSR